MNENIKALVKKVKADKALSDKLGAAKDLDEAYAIASSIQSGFTKDEFAYAVSKVTDAMNTFGELTDGDIAKVAGGAGVSTIIDYIQKTVQTSIATIQQTTQAATQFKI